MIKKTSYIWRIEKKLLEQIIKDSYSYKEVLEKLDFSAKTGGNYKTLKKRILADKIDISHFKKNTEYLTNKDCSKITLIDFCENSFRDTGSIKNYIIKYNLINYQCKKCNNNGEWLGEKLTLQLDHINGINNDNRLENLRFLCPNCHSQTKTYSRKKCIKEKKCIICNLPIYDKYTKKCINCKQTLNLNI